MSDNIPPLIRAQQLYRQLCGPIDSYVIVEYDSKKDSISKYWHVDRELLDNYLLADNQYAFWGGTPENAPSYYSGGVFATD